MPPSADRHVHTKTIPTAVKQRFTATVAECERWIKGTKARTVTRLLRCVVKPGPGRLSGRQVKFKAGLRISSTSSRSPTTQARLRVANPLVVNDYDYTALGDADAEMGLN